MPNADRQIIEIYPNGDPYGRGFQATSYKNQAEYEAGIGVFEGGLSPMPRRRWRTLAKKRGAILRQRY